MNKMLSPEKQYEILSKDTADFVSKQEFLTKLKKTRPLIIKAGFDPSRPDIHLGHLLLIGKLRKFQDLGHKILFVVGDWTACIGDPSGQNKTRPLLSKKEAEKNAETYISQAMRENPPSFPSKDKKVLSLYNKLRRLDRGKTQFVFNSKWLENLSLGKFISDIASRVTLARILERNDFSQRYKLQKPIALHEFLYPALQAYDSVELKADVEIGGTDQLFNLLLGRELQKDFEQQPQCILTLPLLEGLDGQQKMSQSLNNTISFKDSPEDIFGKIMNISDDLMIYYWEKLGGTDASYRLSVENKSLHPMKEKELLALSLTSVFYGAEAAEKAKDQFNRVFSKRKLPKNIPEKNFKERPAIRIYELLKKLNGFSSASEARRFIEGGGLLWNGEKITDPTEEVDFIPNESITLRIGRKHFLKVHIKPIPYRQEFNEYIPTSYSLMDKFSNKNRISKESPDIKNKVPLCNQFYLPVLKSVNSREVSNDKEIKRDVISHFCLSSEAINEKTKMGQATKFSHRIQWALFHLYKANLIRFNKKKKDAWFKKILKITDNKRDGFSITKEGKEILKQFSNHTIDQKFLRNYCPSFKKWENELI